MMMDMGVLHYCLGITIAYTVGESLDRPVGSCFKPVRIRGVVMGVVIAHLFYTIIIFPNINNISH